MPPDSPSRESTDSWNTTPDAWAWREAAAVLVSFDFESLQPFAGSSLAERIKPELLADCDPTEPWNGEDRWALARSVRIAALHRLATRDAFQDAIAANPQRDLSTEQRVFETILTKKRFELEWAPLDDLQAALRVCEWVRGLSQFETVPSADLVRARVERAQFLQPFRDLAGSHFAGRVLELERLSDHVGHDPSHDYRGNARRHSPRGRSNRERPHLFVHGPGGYGKSTLIAKFILDHADIEPGRQLPIVYLDLDRPSLRLRNASELVREIWRQLTVQFPERTKEAQFDPYYVGPADKDYTQLSDQACADLARAINAIFPPDLPLMLVLDTFEEVQFRGSVFMGWYLGFLSTVQKQIPTLRTVLVGRAEVQSSQLPYEAVRLDSFDQAAASVFLHKMGVTDPAIAQAIYEQIGGSPLCLRLAARIAVLEDVSSKGIQGLDTFFLRVRSDSIHVVLYKRILEHIHDPRVAAMVRPGLVLRRVTPDILLNVLAKACHVEVQSLSDAAQLLRTMRDQLSTLLVPGDEPDTLVHRSDMRQLLLEDLRKESRTSPKFARDLEAIHEMAIQYYYHSSDLVQRAEEVYHRLAIDEPVSTIVSRWMPQLEDYIGSSVLETSKESQITYARLVERFRPDIQSDKDIKAHNSPSVAPDFGDDIGPIALALSGGGYRAAAFHLGVLDVLHRLGLLDLAALSSTSGGTIVALRFLAGRVRPQPESFDEFYRAFTAFLRDTNVVEHALQWLESNPSAPRSVIVGVSNVYASERFLGDMRFTEIRGPNTPTEAGFATTDCESGLSFRFQISLSGLAQIGNSENVSVTPFAADVRLADIVAASGCSPGAFEPLQLPGDFPHLSGKPVKPIALIDGGIYDPMGIDQLFLCLDRLKQSGRRVGLVAVSDTTQRTTAAFLPPSREAAGRGAKIDTLLRLGQVSLSLVALAAVLVAGELITKADQFDMVTMTTMMIVASLLGAVSTGTPLAWRWITKEMTATFPAALRSLWPFVKKVPLADTVDMIRNRVSAVVMTSDILTKRVREMSMRRLFGDNAFAGRRVGFFVYELRRPVNEGDRYKPSTEQIRVAEKGDAMPTTLWASATELRELIACGQNTAVLKLLRHLQEREQRGTLSRSSVEVRNRLQELWMRLTSNAYVLVDEHERGTPTSERQKVAA